MNTTTPIEHELIMVEIFKDGQSFKALLDPGANINIMSMKCLNTQEMNNNLKSTSSACVGVTATPLQDIMGELATKIYIKNKEYKINAMIIKKFPVDGYNIILGMKF